MNISHLLLCTSLLAAPVCAAQGLTETETETPASSSRLPAPLAQKIVSGDFDGLQTELRSTLLKAGEQTKSEQKLLQNKQYRHLLDIHELLRVTGPDKVKAVFSKSAQDAAFIKTFLQNPAWMELYLGAGLIPENSPEGLQILSDIWKADGKSPDFRSYQSLAHRAGLCLFHRPHGGKAQNQLRQQQSGAPLPDFQKTASGKQAASGIHQTAPMGNALRRGKSLGR